MTIFTAEQMRAFDKAAGEWGVPSIVLMENAALRVVEYLKTRFSPLHNRTALVMCGKGNNGGDGLAIARHLLSEGCRVVLVPACKSTDFQGDALVNFKALSGGKTRLSDGGGLTILKPEDHWPQPDFIIDALLGTGFQGAVRPGPIREVLQAAAALREATKVPVIAVDVPSGLSADTGKAADHALRADVTVTFAAPKRGFFVQDGPKQCGELWVGGIGTLPAQMASTETGCSLLDSEKIRVLVRAIHRPLDAHKGDAGRVLVSGGSVGMSGAPILASRAALASGVGLCLTCVSTAVQPIFAAACLEATSRPLPCDGAGALIPEAADLLAEKWQEMQAVALGPGAGRSDETLAFVRRVARECPVPLIIDADALYGLRAIAKDVAARKAATILTPHPGEMGELLNLPTGEVQKDRYAAVSECARRYNAVVVLKGSHSLIAIPGEGREPPYLYVNTTGNAGMATGGSGDVLTGILAGLLAQVRGLAKDEGDGREGAVTATLLGVYAHGLAGDLAFDERGNGLVAHDIINHLPKALLKLTQDSSRPETARLRQITSAREN